MDICSLLGQLLGLPVLLLFLCATAFLIHCVYIPFPSSSSRLPGPGISEYFPNGIAYPLLRNPQSFSAVLEKLGQKYGDIFTMWMGPTRVLVTALPGDVKQILSRAEDFDRPPAVKSTFQLLAPDGIFCMTGSEHRAMRKKIRDGFHHGMLQTFHKHMADAIQELCGFPQFDLNLNQSISPQSIDLTDLLSITSFRIMMHVAFGASLNREDRLEFLSHVHLLANEMTKDIVGYPIRMALAPLGTRAEFCRVRDNIRKTCAGFFDQRRKETLEEKSARDDDLLDALQLTEGYPLATLTSIITEFTLGGTYSVSQSIVWGVFEICCNQRVRIEVEKELEAELGGMSNDEAISFNQLQRLKYIRNVWKEVCRVHPIGPFITRQTTREVSLKESGILLPKGTQVLPDYRKCQLSSRQWRDPESFKPERWDSEHPDNAGISTSGLHVPYGLGPHSCPGSFLADHEGSLVIAELFRRFQFTLACRPDQVKTSTTFVESPVFFDEALGISKAVPFFVYRKSM